MRAVILAAGFGTRLGPLGVERPKGLLEVGGRPAIEFVARAAEALPGVRALDVVTNARFHGAYAAWAAQRAGGRSVRLWNDGARHPGERLGAIGDLHRWLGLARPREAVLVLAADNVFDFSLVPLAARARREPVVALYEMGSPERVRRLASVELDGEGRVVRFVEKDPAPRSTLACVALYGLPRGALGEVERYVSEGGRSDNLGFFVEWLHRRRPVRGLRMEGRFADIGTPEEYARARLLFAPSGSPAPVPGRAGARGSARARRTAD
jgi:glucose-1-phosphate thymidylyltransferase